MPYHFSKLIFRNKKNIEVIKGDLYQQDVSAYDVVIFFLRKNHKVDEIFGEKFKKGAIIISNHFPLKTFTANETVIIKDPIANRHIYFYQF